MTTPRVCILVFLVACGGATSSSLLSGGGGDGGTTSSSGSGGASSGGASSGSSGASSGTTLCSGLGTCSLVSRTCCGVCGGPALADMTAVTAGTEGAYQDAVCGPVPPPCPKCATMQDPNLLAMCRDGNCTAIDLRVDEELAGCKSDDDCVLRAGGECCQECGEVPIERVIAIARTQVDILVKNACVREGGRGCPADCVPTFPRKIQAKCSGNRCRVN